MYEKHERNMIQWAQLKCQKRLGGGRKPNEVAKILRLAVKKCHRNYCVPCIGQKNGGCGQSEDGKTSAEKALAIQHAADLLLKGENWDEFPLVVWQTGSGTQVI